jgi:hypothetical protein
MFCPRIARIQEHFDMLLSDAVTNQFEGWMDQFNAELREGVHERFRITDDVSSKRKLNNALQDGDQEKVPTHTIGLQSLPVLVKRSRTSPHIGNVCSVDPETLYYEDRLGCVRGVAWAVVFEAALVIAVAVYWRLRLFLR